MLLKSFLNDLIISIDLVSNSPRKKVIPNCMGPNSSSLCLILKDPIDAFKDNECFNACLILISVATGNKCSEFSNTDNRSISLTFGDFCYAPSVAGFYVLEDR